MGDRAAEPGRGSGDRIDMDELMILGRVGKGGDSVLADLDPFRRAYGLPELGTDFIERGDRHWLRSRRAPARLARARNATLRQAYLLLAGGAQGITSVPSGAAVKVVCVG